MAAFGVPVNLLGIPFQRINLGYHLSLSPIVQHCFHAVSLDERRPAFRETRVKNGYEVWFRGVHSDVGGGNDNIGLSDIALRWMLRKALLVGLPIDTQAVAALDASARPDTPISDNKDPFEASFRTIPAGARMHYTVSARAHCSNPPDGCGTETAEDESNRVGT